MDDMSWENVISAVPDNKCKQLLKAHSTYANTTIEAAIKAFRTTGFTLVTGAGVSVSAGVPSWSELLARLRADTLKQTLSKKGARVLGELIGRFSFTDSPLVAARQITAAVDEAKLPTLVREILYENVSKSSLLAEVARLCVKNDGLAGIHGILTYNFDVLLEEALRAIGRQPRTLYRSTSLENEGFPVRHVHGFLQRTKNENEGIVLTEAQYHDEYARPYSWSNVVQLNTFRETSCLFVGSSMTDPNQRRLLEIARREHPREHFAILRRTPRTALRATASASWAMRGRGLGRPSKAQGAAVGQRVRLACYLLDQSRAQGLEQLGARVIWVDNHGEVPDVLERIRGGSASDEP